MVHVCNSSAVLGGQRRLDLRGLLSSQASKNRKLQLQWRPSLKNEEQRDRRSSTYTSGLHMHVDGWAHLHIYTSGVHALMHTHKEETHFNPPDCALSNARRPRCLRPLEAEIRRPAAVQLQSGKKLMFHLPPFHSVKRSSWGKASLNTGECFPGDRSRTRASTLKQILPAGNSLSRRMVGISGESSIFFKGFIPWRLFMIPLGQTSFWKPQKLS